MTTTYGVRRCKNRLHEMVPSNIFRNKRGHYRCRACDRDYDQRRRERDRPKRNAVARRRHIEKSALPIGIALCRNRVHEMVPANVYRNKAGFHCCLACRRAADLRRHAKDKDKRNADKRARYHERYREDRRERTLAKYGLTPATYEELLVAQGDGCAICGSREAGGQWNTHFHVDHVHGTRRVRGLLCGECNIALGNMKDDPERLRAAADYLERTG